MWVVEVFPSLLEGAPLETHRASGSLADWLDAAGIPWREREQQPMMAVIDGQDHPVASWGQVIPAGTTVRLYVIPAGSIGKFFKKLFKAILSLFMPKKKQQSRIDTPQARNLETTDASANEPKLGAVVPELAGRFRRYPDYLTPPHRYFQKDDPRVQSVEFHACVGAGYYQIDPFDVKIGNTPFRDIGVERAEFKLFEPGANLIHEATNDNWYSSPEVGATSGGSSGIDLSADVAVLENEQPVGGYTFSAGKTITRANGAWPVVWGVGTVVQILKLDSYKVEEVYSAAVRYKVTGNFKHLLPVYTSGVNGTVTIYNPITKQSADYNVYAKSLDANGDGFLVFTPKNSGNTIYLTGGALFGFSNRFTAYKISGGLTSTAMDVVRVKRAPNDDPAKLSVWTADGSFEGFKNGSSATSVVSFVVAPAYGLSSALFQATPAGESTNKLELDFFFPSGLVKVNDDGSLSNRTVSVGVVVTDSITQDSIAIDFVYTQKIVDQIGFSEVIDLPDYWQPVVSVRRNTKASTSSSISDKVVWYGLKSKLYNRDSYPNWTTIGIKLRSGGKLGAGSENQINLIATRKLQRVLAGGVLSVGREPTREISAFLVKIAQDIGYNISQIDMVELARLQAIWTARGDHFDHIFDATTARSAIGTTLAAGFAEMTIEDGRLRVVRDEPRTAQEQAYSAQNMTTKLKRAFRAARPDDTDGVEVDYMDAETWVRKTIICEFAGGARAKLEKINADGVTSKTRAWRLGMRRLRENKYRRWQYDFGTELDALCSNYLSYIQLFDEVPNYHQTAMIDKVQGLSPLEVYLTEDIRWSEYAGKVVLCAFRGRDGRISPSWVCTRHATKGDNVAEIKGAIANTALAWLNANAAAPTDLSKGDPIHAFVGVQERFGFPALVTEIRPKGTDGMSVSAVNYDARVYADDDSFPPVGS